MRKLAKITLVFVTLTFALPYFLSAESFWSKKNTAKPAVPAETFKRIILYPKNNSTFIAGDEINILAKILKSPFARRKYQYCFYIDDTIIRDWSSKPYLKLKTNNSQAGKHTLKVEIKDNKENTYTASSEILIKEKAYDWGNIQPPTPPARKK